MDTFKPYSFTIHIVKPVAGMIQRCQLCKAMIGEAETILVTASNTDLQWFFKCAHQKCIQDLLRGAFEPLLNESVSVTPKVTRDGEGKVAVSVGKTLFTFTVENSYNLSISLMLASVASSFDAWVYKTLTREAFDPIPTLIKVRLNRSTKTITDASVVGNTQGLLLQCWGMFVDAIEEIGLRSDSHLVKEWEKDFTTHFGIEEERESIQ